jgi:hypothetical protein
MIYVDVRLWLVYIPKIEVADYNLKPTRLFPAVLNRLISVLLILFSRKPLPWQSET